MNHKTEEQELLYEAGCLLPDSSKSSTFLNIEKSGESEATSNSNNINVTVFNTMIKNFSFSAEKLLPKFFSLGEEYSFGFYTFLWQATSPDGHTLLPYIKKYITNVLKQGHSERPAQLVELNAFAKHLKSLQKILEQLAQDGELDLNNPNAIPTQYSELDVEKIRNLFLKKAMKFLFGLNYSVYRGPYFTEEQLFLWSHITSLATIVCTLTCGHTQDAHWLPMENTDFFSAPNFEASSTFCSACKVRTSISNVRALNETLFLRVRNKLPWDELQKTDILDTVHIGSTTFILGYATFETTKTYFALPPQENLPPTQIQTRVPSKTVLYAFPANLTGAGFSAPKNTFIFYRSNEKLNGNAKVILPDQNGKINFNQIDRVARETTFQPQLYTGVALKYLTYIRITNVKPVSPVSTSYGSLIYDEAILSNLVKESVYNRSFEML